MTNLINLFQIESIFLKTLEYLNYNNILKLKKSNNYIENFVNKNFNIIIKILFNNTDFELIENEKSYNFHKKNITFSVNKSTNINTLEKAINITKIFKNTQE